MLRFYRDFSAAIPDELSVAATLAHAPGRLGHEAGGYGRLPLRPIRRRREAVQPIKGFGTPVIDALGPMPYCRLNSMLDGGYPKGALNYWKSSFLTQLSDGAIDTMIECFEECPTPMGQLLLEHFHGAATRVGATDTAFPHRRDGYNFLVASQTMDPAMSTGARRGCARPTRRCGRSSRRADM